MNASIIKANLILFGAATVWGTTFVAQRVGMDHVGPITFSAVRFTLGALFLLPFAYYRRHRPYTGFSGRAAKYLPLWAGLLTGLAMSLGINLQQVGLVSTTAGNAGFITGLYVIIVPLAGFIWGYRPSAGVWIGAVLGAVGLYLLSVTRGFHMNPGDGWVLACAFAWAAHVWILGWLSPRMDSYVLAFGQAAVTALISWTIALIFEEISWAAVARVWFPVLWGGLMSVGVGFTMQVIGQKDSPPAHAAIILSLEAVIAAFSGWLILDETMTGRTLAGAGLMLTGMLIAQLWDLYRPRTAT
jgi:drug/metabolite transporter (DMT)-like permease